MRPEADWQTLYPFESHRLNLDGHQYHYLDEGAGSPLLLVHGNPTWSFYWHNLVRSLRDRYRLIVPDHMGCGLSDKPQAYPYRLAQHVSNLRALVERLDLNNIALLAHDWGGAIGLGAAVETPERFSRLVLMNTAAFRSHRMPLRIRVCRTPGLGAAAVRGLNAFARAALWMAVRQPARLTPAIRAGLLAPYDSWRNRVAIQRFVEDIPLSPRHPSYGTLSQIEARLPGLADRPVLLVWGMQDWCFTPHFLARFRQFFPAAEVCELENAGHYVVLDEPQKVLDRVEAFLHGSARPVAETESAS